MKKPPPISSNKQPTVKKLEKEKQATLKVCIRKEIIKIREERNIIESRK